MLFNGDIDCCLWEFLKKYSVLDRKLKIQLRVVWNSDDDDQNICKPIGTLLFEFLRKSDFAIKMSCSCSDLLNRWVAA